uniref:Uncharacterized protein n=1 Tax=Rhizophora mucronata TaxID=61149 RepID=A0A2P2IUN2_RHIMU
MHLALDRSWQQEQKQLVVEAHQWSADHQAWFQSSQ